MGNSVARTATGALGGVLAVGAAAFAYGALVERNRFTVRQEHVPVLDVAARPITVLHLSDLHMAPWQHRKQEWIRALATVEPDLIVNTGDNLGHPDGLEGLRAAFEPFRGVPGVFVNGSNDYYASQFKNPFSYFMSPSSRHGATTHLDTEAMEEYFDSLGWWSLNNSARAIELKGSRIEFFGVNDAHRGWDRLDRLPAVVEELRENVGWQDEPGGSDPSRSGSPTRHTGGCSTLLDLRRRAHLRRPHPRRPGADSRATGHWSPTATSRANRRRASASGTTRATPPTSTSARASARRSTPRCASPARPRPWS